MLIYATRRLLGAIPLLIGVSFVVFLLLHIAPGDPAEILAGGRHLDPRTLAEIRAEFHLNDPFFVQYGLWLSDVVRGNFGNSIPFHETVAQVVAPRILPTLELGGLAVVLVAVAGLGLGILSALRRNSFSGRASAVLMLTASTVSPYVAGVLLITVFGVILGWFPILGLGGGGLDRIYHLTLPAVALAMGVMALVGRTCQTSLTQTLGETFIEAARSRGFSERRVVIRHGLRNALLPVVTMMGVSFGYLITGAVLIEYVFGLAGLGSLLVQAVQDKDYATVQAVTMLFAGAFVVINLGVDLLYAVVDPRVRMTTGGETP